MSSITIALKLYASLIEFFPEKVKNNRLEIGLKSNTTVAEVLSNFQIPAERAHLVLINGVYIPPEERAEKCLRENDVLAVWPPVAGG
jgi:sulfur carrier protein ThiS